MLFLLLSYSNFKKESTIFPEILYVLEKEDFMNLLDLFGGKTVKIPSKSELLKDLKFIKYFCYKFLYQYEKENIKNKMSISEKSVESYEKSYKDFLSYLESKNNYILKSL